MKTKLTIVPEAKIIEAVAALRCYRSFERYYQEALKAGKDAQEAAWHAAESVVGLRGRAGTGLMEALQEARSAIRARARG